MKNRGFNPLVWIFNLLANTVMGAEGAVLNVLIAFVPYLVPIIPAYLTFFHTKTEMGFPDWVAWTAAVVVEALGLASVATAVRFYRHNLKYKKDENRAPFKTAMAVYIFYVVIVLVVNVILEAVTKTRSGWVITAIALFSLLSFPSGVLISLRTQYADMLSDDFSARPTAKNTQANSQPDPSARMKRVKHASDYQPQIVSMLNEEFARSGQVLAPKQITTQLKLDHDRAKGYVSTLTSKWMAEKGIQRPAKPLGF